MNELSINILLIILVVLIILSACFSGSETAMMSVNRYRLRHLSNAKIPGARRTAELLDRPDRLIGFILLGNNLVNFTAASIATVIVVRLYGEGAVLLATVALTIVVLIFAELTPKTLAILHPEKIAFPAAFIIKPLLKITYPIVWVINTIANNILALFGISAQSSQQENLNSDELRTVVNEAAALIPQRHKKMLINILDLEKVSVNDIMIPRNEIVGINLNDDWKEIVEDLKHSEHTRMPVYRDTIEDIVGYIHARNLLTMLDSESGREAFEAAIRSPYFVPEGTPLNTQLLNFQREKRRIGLVVDEYGDIQGLVTLEDILEEIVGEFTTSRGSTIAEIQKQEDGSYILEGSVTLRMLNRILSLQLDTSGPKTLNGLILETLESIPERGTSVLISGHSMEIKQTKDNVIRVVQLRPYIKQQ
ncbi:MAG: HlyC/CorC family transporter [Gammaproteobacteria bacterium]|nr:HlyC/CorC family transporter [Gammaproteobacteria bacterium]